MTIEKGSMSQERSLLRWGGLAGMLGGLVFILVPIILFGFVPQAPPGSFKLEGGAQVDPGALVRMFPDTRAAISVGNFVNFVSGTLSLALMLSLFQALRRSSLAPALFGAALYILGLGVIFTETVTQIAFDPISNLYNSPGVTQNEQATLTLMWQATQGIFFELDAAAILLLSAGLIVLGVAMLKAQGFGKLVGGVSMIFGTVSLFITAFFGITSSLVAILLVPMFIALPMLFGWKVYKLSRIVQQ